MLTGADYLFLALDRSRGSCPNDSKLPQFEI